MRVADRWSLRLRFVLVGDLSEEFLFQPVITVEDLPDLKPCTFCTTAASKSIEYRNSQRLIHPTAVMPVCTEHCEAMLYCLENVQSECDIIGLTPNSEIKASELTARRVYEMLPRLWAVLIKLHDDCYYNLPDTLRNTLTRLHLACAEANHIGPFITLGPHKLCSECMAENFPLILSGRVP